VKKRKLLRKIVSNPKNIRFKDLVSLAEAFGFHLERITGSHHIFSHKDITEIVNLQDAEGKAKPYQIRQLLKLVERYNLKLEDEQ